MSNTQRRLLPSTGALAAFDSVARLGSFSAAAAELSLTQGAISRQIALLEDQLGVRLFHRNGRGVELTDTGKTYAVGISDVVRRIRLLSLQAMSNESDNRLSLAILPTFGTRWLLPRIPDFVARHPEIIINFATRIKRFDFEAEGMDAAIHIGQPDWPGADCQFMMHEDVVPVASPEFLVRHAIAAPADLMPLPRIEMASRPGAWEHWFASLGIDVKPGGGGMRFEQFSNVAQAAIAGLGIALMPTFLIGNELDSRQLVRVVDHPVRSTSAYYLVRPLSKVTHPPVVAFSKWLLEQVDLFERGRAGDGGG